MTARQLKTTIYAGMTWASVIALLVLGAYRAFHGDYGWAIFDWGASFLGFRFHGWCESLYEHD